MEQQKVADLETVWQEAERKLATSPTEGLVTLDRIAGDLLRANGYETEATSGQEVDMDLIARVDDPEMLLTFIEARAVTDMLVNGRTTGPETIDLAVEAYRGIYDNLRDK